MDAIVLAGGFARRMGELVRHTPKQLLPVAGEPLLAHVLHSLEAVAPDRVLLAVNAAFASQFDAFIASYDGPLMLELAVEQARAEGYEPVVVEAGEGSEGVGEFTWPQRPCLVLGNEATGVSPLVLEASLRRVSIPMCGVKESFNVAVAFGIAAHHAARALAPANPGVVFRG